MLGSKLILEEPNSSSSGNDNFALYCADDESSVNDLGLLDADGPVSCTGY
jgi:hypothetical protein